MDCLEEILTPLCRHSEIFIDEWQVYILLVFPSQTLIKTFKHELKYTGEKKKSFYFGFGNSFFRIMENKDSLVIVENKIPPNGKKKRFSTIIGAMKGWYTNARLVPYYCNNSYCSL